MHGRYPAERYADMTKTLFLALFYSALFPAGLFLTSLTYSISYLVDKYSLLRSWQTPAELSDTITKISRGHMMFAVYLHSVMSMIFFSQFPFDGVCENTEPTALDSASYLSFVHHYNITTDQIYLRCDQSFVARLNTMFLDGSTESNSVHGKQKRVAQVFVVLTTVLTLLFCGVFFGRVFMKCYQPFHDKVLEDQPNETHFTECEIRAYIPVITHPNLAFPLVAADVSTFDCTYLSFQLPRDELYYAQSLFNKNELPNFTDNEMKALFSEVRFFPPPAPADFDHFLTPRPSSQKKKLSLDFWGKQKPSDDNFRYMKIVNAASRALS